MAAKCRGPCARSLHAPVRVEPGEVKASYLAGERLDADAEQRGTGGYHRGAGLQYSPLGQVQ